jgi:hypothetical protein
LSAAKPETRSSSAHACFEIGLKWFLFAFYGLGTVLAFEFVPEFLAQPAFSNPQKFAEQNKNHF